MSEPAFGEPGWRQTLGTTVVHKCNNCGIVTPAPELEVARMEVERLRGAITAVAQQMKEDGDDYVLDYAKRLEDALNASDGGANVPAT